MAWLAIFFVVPIVTLVSTSTQTRPSGAEIGVYRQTFRFANYTDTLSEYLDVFLRSFGYALIATVLALAISYPLAYAIAFKAGRWRNVLLVLVVAPFFVSFLLRTIAWKQILAGRGHRHHVQLPAVHDPADLRLAGAGGPPPDRGRGRPLRQRAHHVAQGHLPAVAARRRGGHAAHVHPGRR
jgi:ABC-type spermidine/putrescine transport system permease subunit I